MKGDISGEKNGIMYTERIRIVLDNKKTSKVCQSQIDTRKVMRLAEVPKIFGIEEMPIVCWCLKTDLGIHLRENKKNLNFRYNFKYLLIMQVIYLLVREDTKKLTKNLTSL